MSDIETRIAEISACIAYTHRMRVGHCSCGKRLAPPSDSSHARHFGEVIAAELVRELGLTEFTTPSPVAERWWATSIQHCDENGEWQWPTT